MLNLNIHVLPAAIKRAHVVPVFDSGDPLAGLKALPQWVVWRLEQFEGDKKPRKMPYDPKTFQYANTMDAASWSTFDHASQIASIYPEFKPGFVFTLNDPYVFIDLDGCRNPETGQFDEETTRIFTSVFPNAAAEVSQSGAGLHLIMRGDKIQFGNRRNKWEGRFEFYQSGRFIAIAGNAWQGNADTDHTAALQTFLPVREYDRDKREREISRDLRWSGPEDDQELLIRMFASDEMVSADRIAKLHTIIQRDPTNFMARVELQKIEKRVAFAALWQGDANVLRHFYPSPNGQPFDHSAADLSLMNKLAFWTGRDHERMIRLFGMSALGKRQKWLERAYYRNRTTSNSRAVCREVYRGTPQERRDKQRKENARIGEQMEFNTTAKMLTLEAMVESFYFVANAGSSGSVADASNLSAVSIAVARNQYAPSKTTVKVIDKRTMQEKEKIVPSLELWLADGRRKQADYLTWNPNGALICEPPEKVGQSAFNSWCGLVKPKYGDYFIANIEERERLVHAWNDHLAYLIPHDNERHKFEQWVAHILQRPGDKVEAGWCFIATNTGIGRNWLGTVLSNVLRGYVLTMPFWIAF